MDLSNEEKKFLLKTARDSIKSLFHKIEIEKPDYSKLPNLKARAGAFVTLTIDKRLRGCIGYITAQEELFNTVKEVAVQSAVYDPRFSPLTESELDMMHIEISVLSEPFPMKSYNEIVLGKHGLIVEEKGRRGLLLPQVPVEHNMSKDEYLSALCQKAGLASYLWKEKTLKISMFTATVFEEE